MKRLITILCMVAVIATISAKTIWFGDMMQKASSSPNTVQPQSTRFHCEIAQDSTSATFSFSIPSAYVECDSLLYPESYWWEVNDFYPSCVAGEPALPQRSLIFQLPGNAENITLTENHSQWQTIENYTPTPARPPLLMEPSACYTLDNVQPISKYISLNSPVASISAITRQRTSKLVYVHLQPFKYEGGNTVSVCYNFSYTLTFDKSDKTARQTLINQDLTQTKSDSPKNVSPFSLDSLTIISDESDELNEMARNVHECMKHIRPSNYLIITTPQHYDYIHQYAEFKKKLGHGVRIVTSQNWTQSNILNTIRSQYQADSALHYVLFAGSISEIPAMDDLTPSNNEDTTNYSDFPYSVLCNDGYERSVFTGRLLVEKREQMPNITHKLMSAYTYGYRQPSYHKNATHITYFDLDSQGDPYIERRTMNFVQTTETIHERAASHGKQISRVYYKHPRALPKYWRDRKNNVFPLPDSLAFPNMLWNADSSKVIKAFNSKPHYIFVYAHGSLQSWADQARWYAPLFHSRLCNRIYNKNGMPFVFSISCSTGNLSDPKGLAKTLLNSPNGAYGVIASSRIAYTNQTIPFASGLFHTIWPDTPLDANIDNPNAPINLDPNKFAYDSKYKKYVEEEWYAMGNIMDLGMRYESLAGINKYSYSKGLKEIFHLFGDPGIFFNTETPTDIENVRFSLKSVPNLPADVNPLNAIIINLESYAIVGIYNITQNSVTRYYTNSITHIVKPNDNVYVTITQHNKLPLEFHIENDEISSTGAYIGDNPTTSTAYITHISQKSLNSIEVGYVFDDCASQDNQAEISVKDMSNNLIGKQTVSTQEGFITFTSPNIKPGIYVVTLQSPTQTPSYQKILVR